MGSVVAITVSLADILRKKIVPEGTRFSQKVPLNTSTPTALEMRPLHVAQVTVSHSSLKLKSTVTRQPGDLAENKNTIGFLVKNCI